MAAPQHCPRRQQQVAGIGPLHGGSSTMPLLLLLLLVLGGGGGGGGKSSILAADAFVVTQPACHGRRPQPCSPLVRMSSAAPIIPDSPSPDPKRGFRRLLNLPLPPGPRGLPYVGNMPQLLVRGANFDQYDAWIQRKHGPIARSRLLGACFLRGRCIYPSTYATYPPMLTYIHAHIHTHHRHR